MKNETIPSNTNEYPVLSPATDEEWEKLQPLIEKAKAEGNPWAYAAGIFRNDPTFDEWVEEMRLYRQRVEEEPELWHDLPS